MVFRRFIKSFNQRLVHYRFFLSIVFGLFFTIYIIESSLIKRAFHFLFSKSIYFSSNIVFHDIYSWDLKKELASCIKQQFLNTNFLFFEPADFYINLKERFSIIKKIAIKKNPAIGFEIHITGAAPMCVLNDQMILADNKEIYPMSLFLDCPDLLAKQILWRFAYVGIKIPQDVYDFFCSLSPELCTRFFITYESSSQIILRPKMNNFWEYLIADIDSLQTEEKLQRVDDVVQDICHRGLLSKSLLEKKKVSLRCDLRFKDQIIVKIFQGKRRGVLS
jgi:hypothetical protein